MRQTKKYIEYLHNDKKRVYTPHQKKNCSNNTLYTVVITKLLITIMMISNVPEMFVATMVTFMLNWYGALEATKNHTKTSN